MMVVIFFAVKTLKYLPDPMGRRILVLYVIRFDSSFPTLLCPVGFLRRTEPWLDKSCGTLHLTDVFRHPIPN